MDERKRSLRKEIVRLALPIALQQFMTALVGACDAIMLGKLSQDAMSAVSLATPWQRGEMGVLIVIYCVGGEGCDFLRKKVCIIRDLDSFFHNL